MIYNPSILYGLNPIFTKTCTYSVYFDKMYDVLRSGSSPFRMISYLFLEVSISVREILITTKVTITFINHIESNIILLKTNIYCVSVTY